MTTAPGVVLFVAPQADTRQLYAFALEEQGFLVVEADTAEEAFTQAVMGMPSVVVAHVPVPGPITGQALCRHFRARGVPVVLLTGRDLEEVYAWTRREGCAAVLPKPVAADTLAAIVSCLSGARGAATTSVLRPPRRALSSPLPAENDQGS